jgi:uncharacterized SAM-binding protein YcdF (DUF218 family)
MFKNAKLWILVIAMGWIAFLFWGAYYISPQDELKQADVIVAVSGGDTTARTLEAVRLYQAGWANRLLFSGAAFDPSSRSNAKAMREIAISHGIPPDVITIEERANTTKQNAQEVAAIITALNYKRIILVTSPYHQRRTSIEFQNRLDNKIEIINHSAFADAWTPSSWWRSPRGWYLTMTELPKALFAALAL